MIDIRHLKHFIAVVESNGIRPAAQLVHLSPSSVLRSIQLIEEYYGISLFDKKGKSLRMTRFGEYLLEEARALTAGFDSIAPNLAQLNNVTEGKLRVGLAPGVADLLMPAVTARLLSEYPSVELSIKIESADMLTAELQKQELDLIIAFENYFIGSDNLKVSRIFPIHQAWWVRKDHPLLEKKKLKMEDISGVPILSQRLEPIYQIRLEDILRTADLTRRRRVAISQCNSYPLLYETTLRSDAILLAPQLNVYHGKHSQDLRRLYLPIDMPDGWFSAAYPIMPSPSPLALHFIDAVRKEADLIMNTLEHKLD